MMILTLWSPWFVQTCVGASRVNIETGRLSILNRIRDIKIPPSLYAQWRIQEGGGGLGGLSPPQKKIITLFRGWLMI